MQCRPLQWTCYTTSGMSLITVWMCVVWPRGHILKDCRFIPHTSETWTVVTADGVCWIHVRWEINFLSTFETASFFCEDPVFLKYPYPKLGYMFPFVWIQSKFCSWIKSPETCRIIPVAWSIGGRIQKFPDWPPGTRSANGPAICR
jgi:hypothetical protein